MSGIERAEGAYAAILSLAPRCDEKCTSYNSARLGDTKSALGVEDPCMMRREKRIPSYHYHAER